MDDRRGVANPKSQGFTLMEVLIALSMAALGFGVVLHSVGLQMSLVSHCLERHQMLLYSSQVLETQLANQLLSEKVVDQTISEPATSDNSELQPTQFIYSLESQPVTADPRMEQVTASVAAGRQRVRLSAYRLRIRREPKKESEGS